MSSVVGRHLGIGVISFALVGAAWCGGGGKSPQKSTRPVPVDISADSAKMLVTKPNGQGLHLVDAFSGKGRRISAAATAGYGASLSPDAKLVAFKSIDPVTRAQSPAVYNTETGETTLLATARLAGTPAISAHGLIAYTVGNELRVQAPGGSIIGTFDLGHHVNLLAITDNGKKVAYNDAADQIVVLNLKTGDRTQVTDGKASYFDPDFSPNGRHLLVRTITGGVAVADVKGGDVNIIGSGDDPSWLNNSTVAFTAKTVRDGVKVVKTDLLAVNISGKVKGVLASTKGDAAAAAKGHAIAFSPAQTAPDGRDAGTLDSSEVKIGLASEGQAWTEPVPVALQTSSPTMGTNSIINNGSVVRLTGMPYIHQNDDTPNWWNGNWSCNAAAALMAIQYYDILPPHPITANWPTPHTSEYGWYIPNVYTFNGHTFNEPSNDPNGTTGYGGYGYITQNGWIDTKTHMAEYIEYHGPNSSVDWSPTMWKARNEINNNHPFVLLTSITSAGHYPLVVGYVKNQHTLIFYDPYGNKNSGSYPSPDGRNVRYDWPGYNNGYANLNIVHCYIWARMNQGPSPVTIVVDNEDGGFSASGNWATGSWGNPRGNTYRWRATDPLSDTATWTFNIAVAGDYKLQAWWTDGSNRYASAAYILPNGSVSHEDQSINGGQWNNLDSSQWLGVGQHTISLSCWASNNKVVIGDAVRIVPLF